MSIRSTPSSAEGRPGASLGFCREMILRNLRRSPTKEKRGSNRNDDTSACGCGVAPRRFQRPQGKGKEPPTVTMIPGGGGRAQAL